MVRVLTQSRDSGEDEPRTKMEYGKQRKYFEMKEVGQEFQGAVPDPPQVAPSDLIYLMSSWRLFHPGSRIARDRKKDIALSPLPSLPLFPLYNFLPLKA